MSSRASGTPYPGFQTGSFHDPWSSRILVLVNPSRDSNQLIFQLIFKLPSRGGPPADFKLFDCLARPLEWSLGSPRGPVSLGGSHPSLLGPKQTSASRKGEDVSSSFGSWTGAQPTSVPVTFPQQRLDARGWPPSSDACCVSTHCKPARHRLLEDDR